MSSPRPDAPATLSLEDARALLAAQLPKVDSRSLEVLGEGWEFQVFRTGDGWVFRFPRHPELIVGAPYLMALAGAFAVPIVFWLEILVGGTIFGLFNGFLIRTSEYRREQTAVSV